MEMNGTRKNNTLAKLECEKSVLIMSSRFIETNVRMTKKIGTSIYQLLCFTFLPEFISTIKEFSIFIGPAKSLVIKNCAGRIIKSTRKILKSFKKNELIAATVKSNSELKITSCWSLSKKRSFDLRKFISFIIEPHIYTSYSSINFVCFEQISKKSRNYY